MDIVWTVIFLLAAAGGGIYIVKHHLGRKLFPRSGRPSTPLKGPRIVKPPAGTPLPHRENHIKRDTTDPMDPYTALYLGDPTGALEPHGSGHAPSHDVSPSDTPSHSHPYVSPTPTPDATPSDSSWSPPDSGFSGSSYSGSVDSGGGFDGSSGDGGS